jgi:type IV pilus biogenesis protein CpaD/CtpE
MSSKRLCAMLSMCAMLAMSACGTINKNIGQEDPTFGEAEKYNAAIQTINPAPVYGPDGAQPGDNGDKGAQAVKRYRSDEVKQVKSMGTTSGSGGSSGSSPQ